MGGRARGGWPAGATARMATVVALSAAAVACGGRDKPQAQLDEQRASLSEGMAARVGDEPILVSSVQRVAAAQQIPLKEARAKLVFDALFAAGAKERGLDQQQGVRAGKQALLARALIERLRDEQYAGPITDDELAEFTALHWLDLDRPDARASAHVLVMMKDGIDPKKRKQGMELARRLSQELAGIKTVDEFEARAKAEPHDDLQVVVERLPPITQDGRLADLQQRPPPGAPTPTFDAGYVKGLWSIAEVGQTSEPTTSSYGVHIILLTGLQPGRKVPPEERRTTLAPEIRAARAKKALDELSGRLRQQTPVQVERNADTIFEMLPSGRASGGP